MRGAKLQATLDAKLKAIGDRTCEYYQQRAEFIDFIAKHNISFEDAAATRQQDGGDHNRRETQLFAASIERQTLSRAQQAAA